MLTNQKKCPKCGEDNPTEAVMCWACYTPLTGAAATAATTAGMAPGMPGAPGVPGAHGAPGAPTLTTGEEEAPKKAIQPWQMALVGVGLLIAIGVGVTMMGGKTEEEPITTGSPPPELLPKSPSNPTTVNAPVLPAGPLPAPDNTKPIDNVPYSMVAPPNPEYDFATMGIVSTEGDVTEAQARGLALFAGNQIKKVKPWKGMDIYVFNDMQAAQAFADFQNPRRGQMLGPAQYADPALMSVWPKAVARYYVLGGKPTWASPRSNPSGFWSPKR